MRASVACPRRRVALLVAALVLPPLLVPAGCGGHSDEEGESTAPPRVSTEHGRVVVTLDPQTLARSGIVVEAVTAVTHAASESGYGSVLDVSDLAEMRGGFSAARARVEKGRAALAASQSELDRLRKLYADGTNASQKAVEAATAAARADEAEVQAAAGALEAERALARQRWGPVVAGWLERSASDLDALLEERQRLLEIALPTGASPPRAGTTVAVRAGDGPVVAARVLSPAPRTDPRIQGVSVLCIAPASPGMLPGVSADAQVPVGPGVSGVVVPASAVVWWQGRAWAYVERKTGTFSRSEVATDVPVPGGWFVSGGVAAGQRLVVRGAQMLLSEEGRGAVHGSEG
jgi:hypothetical protein